MKGRYAAHWQEMIAAQPTFDMTRSLALAGFAGIAIDRQGYDDLGAGLEAELGRLLQVMPVVSRNGRYAFLSLLPYSAKLEQGVAPVEWAAMRECALYPVTLSWRPSFPAIEGAAEGPGRRGFGQYSEIVLTNPSRDRRHVEVAWRAEPVSPGPARLEVNGPGWAVVYDLGRGERESKRDLILPAGATRFRVRCNAPPFSARGSQAALAFWVHQLAVTDCGSEPANPVHGRTAEVQTIRK